MPDGIVALPYTITQNTLHGEAADALAMHLLMLSQGVASLATAFRDEAFMAREVDAIAAWLDHPEL